MRKGAADRFRAGLLVLSVAGCTHMSAVPQPADFVAAKRPARVWVTGPDNSEVVVTHPSVRGDTLSGFSEDRYFEIPLADVKRVRASVPALERTLLFAGVGVATMGVIVSRSHGKNGCSAVTPNKPPEDEEVTPASAC